MVVIADALNATVPVGALIGFAIAEAFLREGAEICLVGRDAGKLEAARTKLGGGAIETISADLATGAGIEIVVEHVKGSGRALDILVNNAGVIDPIAALAASDPAAWARSLQINLVGAYFVVRAVLDGMLAAGGGTIVNVSSGAAHRPLEGWSAYCAGKAGLWMMTQSIALETAGSGIRVFGFAPGTIDTDMQVKIRASGVNPVSQIPRANLSPVEHAVRGLVYLCDNAANDLAGTDVSMRDDPFRQRIGLA